MFYMKEDRALLQHVQGRTAQGDSRIKGH